VLGKYHIEDAIVGGKRPERAPLVPTLGVIGRL
jgi:hypothetical protein